MVWSLSRKKQNIINSKTRGTTKQRNKHLVFKNRGLTGSPAACVIISDLDPTHQFQCYSLEGSGHPGERRMQAVDALSNWTNPEKQNGQNLKRLIWSHVMNNSRLMQVSWEGLRFHCVRECLTPVAGNTEQKLLKTVFICQKKLLYSAKSSTL